MEAVGSSGKVFALQWLTVDRILVLGTAGLMTTWEIQTQGNSKVENYVDLNLISIFFVILF